MLTDKELDQIRAIVYEEVCKICLMFAAAIDDGLRDYFDPFMRPYPAIKNGHLGDRASLERMAEIDTRNDERIAAWQAGREGAGQ